MARTEVPLYVKIKEYLLREIREGELKPDDQLPSEKALSGQFQVSRITVRRALAELEEESAIYRRPGKGTFVAEAPQAGEAVKTPLPAAGEGPVIGVIMSHLDSPFQVSLLQSIEKSIGKKACQMMFGLSNGSTKIENELIDRMLAHGVQGMVIYPVDGAFYSEKILRMSMDGFPVVLVDRYLPGINACSVYSDDRRGGQLLGEYLLGRGHRRIGLLSQDPKDTICLMDRIDGFNSAMLAAGVPQGAEDMMTDITNCAVYSDPEQYEENVEKIERFLAGRPEITAVFCTIATFAMNAVWAARRLDRRLEIVCFDSVVPYQWTEKFPITYIAHSETEMGRRAVEAVLRLIAGEKAENIILPCELVPAPL